jgi:glycosyltransferase involved in cell wall biosynthesis
MAASGYVWVATGLDTHLTGIERVAISCARAVAQVDDAPQIAIVDQEAEWAEHLLDVATLYRIPRRRGGVSRGIEGLGLDRVLLGATVVTHSFGPPLPRVSGPKSYTVFDWGPMGRTHMPLRPRLAWMRAMYSGIATADLLHFLSSSTADETPGFLKPHIQGKTIVHGVPVGALELNAADGARRPHSILSVGSDVPRKRFQLLADACSGLPDVDLTLAGTGTERYSQCDHGSLVTGRGRVSDAELRRLYSRTQLFALISEYEGLGLPVLEAWAHGCALLVTDAVARRLPREVAASARVIPTDISEAALRTELRQAVEDPGLRGARVPRPRDTLITLLVNRRIRYRG